MANKKYTAYERKVIKKLTELGYVKNGKLIVDLNPQNAKKMKNGDYFITAEIGKITQRKYQRGLVRTTEVLGWTSPLPHLIASIGGFGQNACLRLMKHKRSD